MIRVNVQANKVSRTIRMGKSHNAPSLHNIPTNALPNGFPHRKLICVGDVQIAKNQALSQGPKQINKIALFPGTYDGLIVQGNIVDLSHQMGNYFNILKQYPHSKVLILSHTQTTGLNMVRANKTLKTLMAGFSKFNNIRITKKLKSLETLDISYTPTTYIDPLKGSETLKNLFIAGSNVEDISALKGIKTLKTLILHEKQIPAVQLQEFRKAVPDCEVIINKFVPAGK